MAVTAALSPSSFPSLPRGGWKLTACSRFVAAHDDLQQLFCRCGPNLRIHKSSMMSSGTVAGGAPFVLFKRCGFSRLWRATALRARFSRLYPFFQYYRHDVAHIFINCFTNICLDGQHVLTVAHGHE
jgi:hypothetical protein